MLAGLLMGVMSFCLLAFLTWALLKVVKNQSIGPGSRGVRTFLIGCGYVIQFALMVYLSTHGGAYLWFRPNSGITRADTYYAGGLVLGIFFSATIFFWLNQKKSSSTTESKNKE